jgi:serine/threonine protein kinase
MKPRDWHRVEELYHAALARAAGERETYLVAECGNDQDLRREVLSLLAHAGEAEKLMEEPAVAAGTEKRALLAGACLGPYEILGLVGAGGMGEVYRAHDTRLGRDVAIKVLPEAAAHDQDALSRFGREARAVAALNHPHIATLFDIGEHDGTHYLVMELLEGETLAARVARGMLEEKDARRIGAEIAEALAAAHRQGVVHRDVKPANVVLTPTGAKLLDFGLARLQRPNASGPDQSQAATATRGDTREGVILGTVAYMSPEQARGKPVDERTDVWAFGCVLYEMLTGRRAFAGETTSDTIAAILGREPDWRALPATTPPGVRRLLHRCLEKDPDRRLHDVGDARVDLEDLRDDRPASRRLVYLASGLLALSLVMVAGGLALFYLTRPSVPATSAAEYTQITNFNDSATSPALSPDGRMVAFKRGGDFFLTVGQIYVKLLPNGESVRLTNDPSVKYGPAFAPDGSRIAYTKVTLADGTWDTWTVPLMGGPPTALLPNASGLTWIDTGRVLFSEIKTGLHMGIVTATEARGQSREIYFPSRELGMAHFSYLSPDHQWLLVVEMGSTYAFDERCRLLPFDGSSAGRQVGPAGICLAAAWAPDGKWMYFGADVGGSKHLWREKFPDGPLEQITFGPTQEEGVALAPDGGSLITAVGRRQSAIWIHDVAGERAITSEGYASHPRLSGDGTRVLYLDSGTSPAAGAAFTGELRSVDLASGKIDSVLPGIPVSNFDVSRDERDIVFTTKERGRESQVWLAPLDRRSAPRQIMRTGDQASFGANGELIFWALDEHGNFLYRINRDGSGRERITSTPVALMGSVSPDGEWVTAVVPVAGEEKALAEAVVVPMETVAVAVHGGAVTKICGSNCGGIWSADGKFLYVTFAENTFAIPVPAGQSVPNLPASGIASAHEAMALTGTRQIACGDLFPGPDPSTYLFERTEVRSNLFRIPLR